MSQTHEDPRPEATEQVDGRPDVVVLTSQDAAPAADLLSTTEPTTSEGPEGGSDRGPAESVDDVVTEGVGPDRGPVESADDVVDSLVDDRVGSDHGAVVAGDGEEVQSESGSGHRSRRAPSRALLEKEGEVAADFLETLLDICDLDGDLDVDIDGDRAAVSIVDSDEGRVPRRLVGSDGKVLDALQELTRLAVYAATGERSRLILDIAGHRASRRSTLVSQAQAAIAAVQENGQQHALEPMSAFERKIVHDEVLAAGLRSESDGIEPRRFVVVLPA